jgi:hypothetical protein
MLKVNLEKTSCENILEKQEYLFFLLFAFPFRDSLIQVQTFFFILKIIE